jgi:hypothetical protein
MKIPAIAAAVLLLLLGSEATAANLGAGPSPGGRSFGGASYDDGPYYLTPWKDRFYVECGKPRIPYRADGYGPSSSSMFLGPVGFRCFGGTYAVDPFYPPRCRTVFIKAPRGWQRERHCN